MNIDELKNTWNQDDSFDETPEISMEQKHRINLPLEKIRKNMRMEFWSTIAMFVFAFAVIALSPGLFKFKFYISILIASMVFVTFFFYSQFFKLYNNMSNPLMKTYDSLKDLLYQFQLNKQYYLSFYLSFVPFLVCEIIIVLEFIPRSVPLSNLQVATTLIGTMVITMPLLFIIGKWWFNKFYGKYILQVENLVNELKK
ncbi:hypothetical protein SAMN05421856_1136 [Chryseobacterium taichungense]|uniref:Uncharacterized protein n=1 Tax=Chryseobacterium taichungense TaxID=295069 RepID=A0A1H8DDL6_9FLAO|nr:hypothetical protein [Chryseobacterium taichungense]SEN05349.1 hypothetical protein SAMN05421856_1136 [Chryseobacterium taichungense]